MRSMTASPAASPDPLDLAGIDDELTADERAVRDSVRALCAEHVDPYVAEWFESGEVALSLIHI